MKKLFTFLRESKQEMTEKVTWMKFSDLQKRSTIVLVASLVFSLVIWAMDIAFESSLSFFYDSFLKK